MVHIDLKYLGDLEMEAIHGPSKVRITTDAPVDNQGKGRSFSPTDLASTALGACMATIMGIVARRDQIELTGMTVTVDKTMTKTTPRRIERLDVKFKIPNVPSKEMRQKLMRAAETCPVHHSLHPDIVMNVEYEWI